MTKETRFKCVVIFKDIQNAIKAAFENFKNKETRFERVGIFKMFQNTIKATFEDFKIKETRFERVGIFKEFQNTIKATFEDFKIKETRFERVGIFKEFQNTIEATFEDFKNKDTEHTELDNIYMLSVCSKGRNGGVDERMAEVFYGSCIYGEEEKITENLELKKTFLHENGASLQFHLNDFGYVTIILIPPSTPYTKSIESAIFIEDSIHPTKLREKSFLKKQWNYLNSYMECTSLYGYPSLLDKLRCWNIRHFKKHVVDNKYKNSKFYNFWLYVFKWVFTVGLSGLFIYFFTIFPNNNTNDTYSKEQINELKEIKVLLQELTNAQKLNLIDTIKGNQNPPSLHK